MASTEVKPPEGSLPAYGSLHGHYWVRWKIAGGSPGPWKVVLLSGPFGPCQPLGIDRNMTVIVEKTGVEDPDRLIADACGRLTTPGGTSWYEIGPKIEPPPDRQGVKG